SLEAAAEILGREEGQAKVIAGGTDILGTMKDAVHAAHPRTIIDLKTIEGLDYIEEGDQGLRIGALTKIQTIATNKAVKKRYPLLAQAALAVASPQLRRMGTIGGNICQEPRCWYYRYPENYFFCTRKGGHYCNALTGENRFHSIFGPVRVGTTPCQAACPGGVNIPAYMNHIRAGDLAAAARTLLEANPLPAITGRVCPHFCEQDCNRDSFDQAVSVRSVERFLGDYILDNAAAFFRPAPTETGRRAAIVGAGPAGLTAAFYLRRMGHGVCVFDKNDEAGGMLTHALPAYRLPQEVVRRTVKAIESAGVEFRLGVRVGGQIKAADLKRDFDAVFLATGAWGLVSIGLEGEEQTTPGLDFLAGVKGGSKEKPGRRVIVIGGGNVAVDAAITARRLGAEEVVMVCLESRQEMPALAWEIEQALEEGVGLMPSWGPARVLAAEGVVNGLELIRCTSVFDQAGSFAPAFDDSITKTVEADRIILAVGQKTDLAYLGLELEMEGGLIKVDPLTQETSLPGLFAGGEATSGPATVIEDLASGRRAAVGIDGFLKKGVSHPGEKEAKDRPQFLDFDPTCLERSSRARTPRLPLSQRSIVSEDASGLGLAQVEAEAKRCFNCGCVAVSPSDIAPALIALKARIVTTKRTLAAEEFFAAGPGKSTILEADELVREIEIPSPSAGQRQAYHKFRLRQSIDFPIVSLASVFELEDKKIKQARLVLGAAAPVPIRAYQAEEYLKGREVSAEAAQEAAALAVGKARPLAKNDYKVQVARTLVQRAIMALA
ncbi:MAG: FAD binding domain-containing protein, partial [Deltaproteobacteria bacterium]|nr:FAD binding domain-containing protein [Deltaproteobacteria bacterium]